jgi:4-hydroxy-tetrahydrodipicolinate synthase
MITGSMVALVTPMHEDGAIDWESLSKLIEFHVQANTDAIVTVGTTGESPTVDHEEHCAIMRFVVEQVAERIPVIGGTGANATAEAISLTECAKDCGVDAALLVTPYYNKPTQQGLYLHYKTIAEAVDIPQLLYNVPGRTACDLLPTTVARLADVPNIIGIKEATGNLERLADLQSVCPSDFLLISGDDATACEFMLRGGTGVISVTSNLVPDAMHRMCMAAIDGDRAQAETLNANLDALHQDLFVEANPIPVKWGLQAMGLINLGIRLPLTWLEEAHQENVRVAMHKAGIRFT